MSNATTGRRPTGYQRHPLEIGPLVFGLIFLGIVAAWGLYELGAVTAADAAWILPIVLVAAGALGVALALTKPRRTEARQAHLYAYATPWAPAAPGEPADDTQTAAHPVQDDAHADDVDAETAEHTADTDTDTETDTDTDTDTDTSTATRERHHD
jgi:hypothetical protein